MSPAKKDSSYRFVAGLAERFKFTERRDAACYLAAMIDGEGTVYVPKTGKSAKRCIQVVNTEWEIIEAVVECCRTLGIHFTITESPRPAPLKSAWTVMISGRDNLGRVRDVVPLRSRAKREKLAHALRLYSDRNASGYRRTSAAEVDERVERFGEAVWDERKRGGALKLEALVRPGERVEADAAV